MKKLYYILFSLVFFAIAYTGLFWINGTPYFVLSDDSMISMWYARTLDLTCEGYSNPLWTLIMIPCQLLPNNLASIPIVLINLACIIGMMRLSKNPLLLGLTFPILFWALRGVEFIPIAFLFFYGIKTRKIIIPIILISLLRADGFIPASILLIMNFRLKELYIYLGTLLLIFGIRLSIYQDIFPNTYYLKLGYSLQERIPRAFQMQNLALLFAPYQYIIPIALLFAYNVYIGGDAWESYGFLNRFLILAIPLLCESLSFKDLFLIKIFSRCKKLFYTH